MHSGLLSSFRRASRRTHQLVCLALVASASLLAAEPGKRTFRIEAGDAATTLRQFAAQAAEQVVFPAEVVRGIMTQAIQGEFTPRQALVRMTTGTALVVVQDDKTGALSVRKEPVSENKGTGHPAGEQATVVAELAAAERSGAVSGQVKNRVTGQYLNNARVSIKGSNKVVFTDGFGVFQLVGLPSGPAIMEVFYTDLDPIQIPLTVPAGGTIEQSVELTSVKRYGTGDIVKLSAFVLQADRETDAQAIAINEQRFAPNIKNVISTDALGDVLGSSAGEFMKFMPGITAEFEDMDIVGISVRGMSSGMTAVTTDGAPSSNNSSVLTRSVDIRGLSLNDISRIELTKVPTPAMAADSLAGSVNMVSKNAFERSSRQLRYGINLSANHENLTLKRTPTPHFDNNTYKIIPGVTFDFTWPVTKTFGIVITGMNNTTYNELHSMVLTWAGTGTGTNVSAASNSNPYLTTVTLHDAPRIVTLSTLSFKADWKVTRHSVLSLAQTINWTATRIGILAYTFNTGTNGTPTPVGGVPMTWDPTFTRGATGRGGLTTNTINQTADYTTESTNLRYLYDDGRWKIESGLSRSASATKRRSMDDPNSEYFFLSTSAINKNPIRINFLDITSIKPGRIEVFDNNNQPLEWRDISNFRGNEALNSPIHNRRQTNSGYLNVRRRFDLLPFPTAMQTGISQRVERTDASIQNNRLTFMGPNGSSGATASLEPYVMEVYKNQDSHYGFSDIEWLSPTRAWRAFHENPLLYSKQSVASENFRINSSEFMEETVQAGYLQAEADLLNNRLRVLTGVRFERTTDKGEGALTDADAVWQRNANGTFVRNAAGNRIRKPEAGAVNSLDQLKLTRTERGAHSNRTYDGYFPSLHLTYSAQENLLLRGAYAKTYGRPDLIDIIPRTVATAADLDEDDEPDPLLGRGTLTIRNPSLRPWTADNFDLSLEYYTPEGGLLSAGVFLKEIKNFFGNSARIATPADLAELGLAPEYVGWNLLTKFNSGDARIKGAEFNVKHSLRALGRWGSYFIVFANATKLDLSGNPGASFSSFIPKSGNWGGSFSLKRFSMTARWNYRGLDKRAPQPAYGPDGYEYLKARITLDVSASYQLTRKLSVAASVNNLLNEPHTNLRYGSTTPDYARHYRERVYGVRMAVGLRGTF